MAVSLLLSLLLSTSRAADEATAPSGDGLEDCGIVPGETYRIGINRLQMPDGRVLTDWHHCRLDVGVRLSLLYDEVPPDEPDLGADKTPIDAGRIQPALDGSAQAASASGIDAFLRKHPEVLLLEARVTAPCGADGTPDPVGRASADDLASRISDLGVDPARIRIVEAKCTAGLRAVRIEAMVVRALQVDPPPVKGQIPM